MVQNPLWKPPEKWLVIGKPSKRPAQPRKIDNRIVRLLRKAQRKVFGRRREES